MKSRERERERERERGEGERTKPSLCEALREWSRARA